MSTRPAGAHYDEIGRRYARYRQADPRIGAQIARALGAARTVINVGGGAGSYEPSELRVVAVEPSTTMIAQRAPDAAPVVRAVAEALPFATNAFDAALALFTVHHWSDPTRGLAEVARVAGTRVVLTWDAAVYRRYWLFTDYLPEILDAEQELPALAEIRARFPEAEVRTVAVPWDCSDGFCTAYWRRPERYLDEGVRAAISAFASVDRGIVESALVRLREDLDSGAWARRHADLLGRDSLDTGCRLVIARS